jgi:SAM-dependent methyltransferase
VDESLALWLRLREAADHSARAVPLLERLVSHLPLDRPLRVVDLATGTGSNIRYLAPRLPGPQQWRAYDRSPALLATLEARMSEWAALRGWAVALETGMITVRGDAIDLTVTCHTRNLESPDAGLFHDARLVTASALLDLVSERWLMTLASRCREAGACALLAITYDGRFACDPVEPEDEQVRLLFNAHQRRDKGLGGPAAGPGGTDAAVRAFRGAGFTVDTAPSDWAIEPEAREFQRALIEGWALAAAEEDPMLAPMIAAWLVRRIGHVSAGRSRLTVGHQDLLAI